MARYSDTLRDQNGRGIGGALVSVVHSSSGQGATLTYDDGSSEKNPFLTNEDGTFYFNAVDDFYDLTFRYGGRVVAEEFGITVGTVSLPIGLIADSLGTSTNVAPSQNAVTSGFGATSGASLVGFQQNSINAAGRTLLDKNREIEVSVTDFGAVLDGATNALLPLSNAMAFLAPSGGVVVIPDSALPLALSGVLQVPDGVAIRGKSHNGRNSIGATVKCLSSTTQIRFGGQGSANAHFSGVIGDFNIDGNGLATDPLYFGRGNDRFVQNIHVKNTAAGGTAIRVEESQNAIFLNVRPTDTIGGKGWVFDRGTGGHLLFGCNSNDTNDYGIYITETWGGGLAQGLYAVPSQIDFYQPIVERDGTGKALYVGACSDIGFHSAIFGSNSSSAAVNLCTVVVESGRVIARLRFHDCQFFGSQTYSTGVMIGNGADVIFTGRPKLNSLLVGLNITAGASVDLKDYAASAVTTMFAGTGTADTYARLRVMQPIEINRTASTDTALTTVNGLSGQYLRIRQDGRHDWGSGSGFTFDTNLYRLAADQLRTDDKLLTNMGLGVGNSAAATTLGTLSKKMEVFDASGNSIGFVPIYATIT